MMRNDGKIHLGGLIFLLMFWRKIFKNPIHIFTYSWRIRKKTKLFLLSERGLLGLEQLNTHCRRVLNPLSLKGEKTSEVFGIRKLDMLGAVWLPISLNTTWHTKISHGLNNLPLSPNRNNSTITWKSTQRITIFTLISTLIARLLHWKK